MDETYISIQNGDHFTVEKNEDGAPAIKIQNTVWVEDPRWIFINVAGAHDRYQAIEELIAALVEVRDAVSD